MFDREYDDDTQPQRYRPTDAERADIERLHGLQTTPRTSTRLERAQAITRGDDVPLRSRVHPSHGLLRQPVKMAESDRLAAIWRKRYGRG